MKKKVLALVCAMTMVVGMSLTTLAASPSAGGVANTKPSTSTGSTSASAGGVSGGSSASASTSSNSGSSDALVTASSNASGQVITEATLGFFASDTTVSDVPGATVTAVSTDTAKKMIAEAQNVAGNNTFIASIVDLHYTGTATFTLSCSNVWKGQNVTILHLKSDGSFEKIKPDSVEDNKVTFTMTSYSPVAIVINTGTASPKTGDIATLMAAMAMLSGMGAAVCGRKAKKN